MLKNYIKIAFRVMLRQKFFAAVNIFGISFTIMIFSIFAGVGTTLFGNAVPGVNRYRTLFYQGYYTRHGKINQRSDPEFFNELRKLKTAERLSMTLDGTITSFKNNTKISFSTLFTDEEYWNIYKYEFLEGRPFTRKEVIEGQPVAVISESVKEYYFGDENAIGRYLKTDPHFRVIGVVKNYKSLVFTGSDGTKIFLPWKNYGSDKKPGSFGALFLARKKEDLPLIKDELYQYINKHENPTKAKIIVIAHSNTEELNARAILIMLGGFVFFVMFIPALNLMGLNINRISERSSEIGIRKAFGASSLVLVGQFITENLIITLLGGILGIFFTFLSGQLINWPVIFYSIGASVFFGLLSGVLPAWRMSKLHAVTALKGGSL